MVEQPRSFTPASGTTNCADSTATIITFPLNETYAPSASSSAYFLYYGNSAATAASYPKEKYLSFDRSANNPLVSIPASTDIYPGTGSFSVEGWAYHTSYTNPRTIMPMGDGSSYGGTAGWEVGGVEYNSNGITFAFSDGTHIVNSFLNWDAGYKPADILNKWAHIVVVFDRTSGKAKSYVNGVKQSGEVDISSVTGNVYRNLPIKIGNTTGWRMSGYIDEVKFYSKALSDSEVASAYQTGSSFNGLKGYWKFDEGTGQTVTDASGNHHDGTLGGSSSVASDDPTWVNNNFAYSLGSKNATLVCPFNGSTTCVGGIAPSSATGAIRYATGSAMLFDGKNDYISAGNIGNINTIEFWIYPSNTANTILDLDGGTTYISMSAGAISTTGFSGTPTVTVDGVATSALSSNAWHQVAISTATSVAATNVTVGKVSTNYFNGKLDELKLSLGATTKLLYHFDENGDDPRNTGKVIDASGNTNNGTITGAKYINDPSASSGQASPVKNGTYANHEGVFVEEGTTNLVSNPSFENATAYDTNWSLNNDNKLLNPSFETDTVSPSITDDFTTFDASKWTASVGTATINSGKLQATTAGNWFGNMLTNNEFTVDLTGWSGDSNTRRDFTSSPDIDPTGGADNFGLEVLGAKYAYQNKTFLTGANYLTKAFVYTPSANTGVNTANIYLGIVGGVRTTIEDTWQLLSITGIPNDGAVRLNNGYGAAAGDKAYFDTPTTYRQNTVLLLQGWTSPNGVLTYDLPQPASGVVPFGAVVRYTDALNYWEVRVKPNTTGNDTDIVEVVAGVETVRATARVGWTAGQTDQMRVTLNGTSIAVEQKKYGVNVWTNVTGYASMATGNSSSQNGIMLYDTSVNRLDKFSITSGSDTTLSSWSVTGPTTNDDFATFDASKWTAANGTLSVNSGKLRADTRANWGNNIVTNPEFATSLTGWGACNNCTISRVDSSTDPGVNSTGNGALDKYVLKVVVTGISDPYMGWVVTSIPGISVAASAIGYAPSSNTSVNAAKLWLYGTGYPNTAVSTEDTWQSLTVTGVNVNGGAGWLRTYPYNGTATIGDVAYFDSFTAYRQNSIALFQGWASSSAVLTYDLPQPATGVVPFGAIVRYTDPLNYWEVRVAPNTATTDTWIIEVVNGVETTRASGYVGWTAGQTDQMRVTLNGTAIFVEQKKYGASAWSSVINYVGMATGTTSSQNGIMLYDTAVNRLDNFSITAMQIGTRDTTTKYVGTASVQLVGDGNYTQSVNVGDTSIYTLTAYAYTTGAAVTSADLELYYGSATLTTTFTSMGGGWYRLQGTAAGVASAKNYGVQVKVGKTAYVDSVELTAANSFFIRPDTNLNSWNTSQTYTLNDQFTTAGPTTLVSGVSTLSNGGAITPATGGELITNGNMEAGTPPTGWTSGTFSGVADERTGGSGVQSMHVSAGGPKQDFSTTNGTWLQMSAWSRYVSTGTDIIFYGDQAWNNIIFRRGTNSTSWAYTGVGTGRATTDGGRVYFYNPGNGDMGNFDDVSVKPFTLSSLFSTVTEATANKIISAGVTLTPGTQAGLVLNADADDSYTNFIIAYHDGSKVYFEKKVGGTYSSLFTAVTANYVPDAKLKVIKLGTVYQVVYNNVLIGSATVTDVTGTKQGLFSTYANNSFTNFLITTNLDGSSADPTGGVRTVTDTNGKLNVTDGALTFGGGITPLTYGNPGIWYDSLARVAGRTIVINVNNTNSSYYDFGFDTNQYGTAGSAKFRSSTSLLSIADSLISTVVATWDTSTNYQLAITLRSTGAFYFIKGGAFTNWTALYASSTDSSPTLYPVFANNNGILSTDNIRIPTSTWLPTPIAYDTFGVNGATATETAGPDAQTAPSLAWNDPNFTWTAAGGSVSNSATVVAAPISDTFATFDASKWTSTNGTLSVNSGQLRAATAGNQGNNLVTNGEFTTNTGGWSGTLTNSRVDSTTDPGIASGGLDNWVMKSIAPSAVYNYNYGSFTTVIGSVYKMTANLYAPNSNNCGASAVRISASGTWASLVSKGDWETLTAISPILTGASNNPYLTITATAIGDLFYSDKVTAYRQNSIALLQGWASSSAMLTYDLPQPATGVVPFGAIVRYTDPLNYWEVRVLPNTAGTDTQIIEVVAGTETVRASATTAWTAGQTDQMRITLSGTSITVEVKKYGASSWTTATSWATMATGGISSQNGIMLYDTAVNRLDNFSIAPVPSQLTYSSSLFRTVNAGTSDVIADVTIPAYTLGTQAGLVIGLDSAANPANFLVAYLDGLGNATVGQKLNGTYTTIVTAATAAWNTNGVLRIIKDGTAIKLYYNNTLIGNGTCSASITGTLAGLFSTYSGNTFDNFTVWPRSGYADAPFEDLTVTLDTGVIYAGTSSAKLVAGGNDANFTKSVNVGNTQTYTITAYAYTTGSAVSTTDLDLYYDTGIITTGFAPMGGGWYKLTGTVTGQNTAKNFGVRVHAGKIAYIDSMEITDASLTSSAKSVNTTAPYYKFGNKSTKIVATRTNNTTIPVVLSTVGVYTLSAYIYDGTTGNVGGIVDATIAQLASESAALTTTYTDAGGGWWRLTNTSGAIPAGTYNWGVQVSTDKTVYMDGVQAEKKSAATTYADGSLGTGYSWSGTTDNSTSTRTVGDLSYSATNVFGTGTGSISMWFKPNTTTGSHYLFTNNFAPGSNWRVNYGSAFVYFAINDIGNVNRGSTSKSYSGVLGNWYHLVATWNNTTQKMQLCINSSCANADTTGTYAPFSSTFNLTLGDTYATNGVISDFRAFDQSLDSTEIINLYNQGLMTHQSGTEATDRYSTLGTYTSPVMDLGANGQWSDTTPIAFSQALNGGTVGYATRTSADNTTWSSWEVVAGNTIASLPRRYLQWKADLTPSTGSSIDSPVISGMTVKYVEDTTAPINPSAIALGFSDGGATPTSLISGSWYNHAHPKFTWDGADDQAGSGQSASGIDSYYMFLTQDSEATPSANVADDCFRATTDLDRSFTVGTTPTLCILTDGMYYLRLQSKDNSGNISNPVTLFTYRYDGTIPNAPASVSSTTVGYTSNNSFTFFWPAATDNGPSGVKGYEYKTGTASGTFADWIFTTGTLAADVSAYQEGQNFFLVRTVDNSSNVSGSTSNNVSMASFYYNASAPTRPQNVNISPNTSESAQSISNVFSVTWDKPATFSGEIQKYYYCVNCTPSANVMTETTAAETVNRALSNVALATQQGKNTLFVVAEDNNISPTLGHGNRNFDAYSSTDFYASTVAPAAPTSLVVSDASDRDALIWRLTLTWKAPATGGVPKMYQVYRATTTDEYTKLGETTSTAYTDADLTQSTKYSYKVRAVDDAGSLSLFSAVVIRSPEGKYTAPPTAGGVPTSVSGSTTATISWTTSRTSFGTVEYGKTISYGSASTETIATKSHVVKVTGLAPGVTYHYRVQSLDDSSMVDYDRVDAYSTDYSFTTLNTASITGISVTDIGLDSAVITWKTSSLATSKVEYGLTLDYGKSIDVSSSASESAHTTRISGLTHSTIYHFRVRGTTSDADDIFSQDNTFQTTIFPKVTALVMNTDQDAAGTTVVLAWSTNVPTTAEIVYQAAEVDKIQAQSLKLKVTSEDLQKMTQIQLAAVPVIPKGQQQIIYSGELLDKHIQRISGLSDGSIYIFTIRGRDEKGNQAISDPIRYVTGADTRPPNLQNVIIETPMNGVGADAKAQIIISWETDEPANSQVLWGAGTGSEYPQASEKETALTTKHVVVLRDLLPTSSYHLKIMSADKTGNMVESKDTVVVTPSSQQAAFDIIIKNLEDVFGFLKL